jgi:predicted metal-dependent enzyme (double-stranded beta helix superfamily)
MSDDTLETFIGECLAHIGRCATPADCVKAIAPSMRRLLAGARSFLEPSHLCSDPERYARNAIHVDPDGIMSLYALVWLPGQWTPIHDHGTWGVVGVVEGTLEERSHIRVDGRGKSAMSGIELARGGVIRAAGCLAAPLRSRHGGLPHLRQRGWHPAVGRDQPQRELSAA